MPYKDNPAGNLADALFYMLPGGIEAAEARGQRELCHDETLPSEGMDAGLFTALGGKIHGPVDGDPMFLRVTLPKGWQKQPTNHSMWSDLVDEKGRKRGSIFYKAAFYDRRAFMRFGRFFRVDMCFYDQNGELYYDPLTGERPTGKSREERSTHNGYHVVDATGKVHFATEKRRDGDFSVRSEELSAPAEAWLREHFPQADDYLAYWDA